MKIEMHQKIIFLLLATVLSFGNCKPKGENHSEHSGQSYYTCPMHPSVNSPTPGTCPVCNMSLIKVEKKEKSFKEQKGNFITLNKRQQLLAGIKTDTVGFKDIISGSTILGKVAIDEEQITNITSRVNGRIDKLYVKTSGEHVQRGNPLYSIYSEQLLAEENEFLTLSEKKQNEKIANKFLNDMLIAAENKLLLWGLNKSQISELEKSKSASPQITFYSLSDGYVTDVPVQEGVYVEEGTTLFKLAELKQVWIEAQAYTNDKISDNSSFQIYSISSPDDIYSGRLVFSNPSIENGLKVQLLRIRIENTQNKLTPGTMVYVSPKLNTKPVLSVPMSAVLLEKMKTVWIMTAQDTFEQRMVETGTENKNLIQILSGIKEGEIIVTSGAYLLSSEFILKSGAGQRHEH